MTELLWQSVLLLALAFFFGAVLACGLKRRFYYAPSSRASAVAVSGVSHAPAPGQPKIEVAPRAAAEGDRFNRAISGQAAAPTPAPAPTPTPAARPAAAPAPASPATATPPAVAAASPASAAAPVAKVSVSTGSGAPVKPGQGGAGPSDELARIRGVDPDMQKRLKEIGIRRYQELAALTAADVKGLNDKLGLKGRIEQENWLGQAQILATGGETYYSRRLDRGMPVPPAVEPAARVPAASETSAAAPVATRTFSKVAPSSEPGDDLTRIRAIDAGLQRQLNEVGVRRFADLATLNAGDVRVLEQTLGVIGRIGHENWVGQASILSTGGETYYSRRLDRSTPTTAPAAPAAAPAASAASPAPAAAPASSGSATSTDVGYLRSVRSEALVGSEASRALRPHGEVDDLKRIRGIGVLIEKKLNSLGIANYEQVANWTGADIERISRILDFKGRIERENWIEQARILATGGQTEFSRRNEA